MQEQQTRLFNVEQTDQSMALRLLNVTGDEAEGCFFEARKKRAVPLVALGESQAFCLVNRDKPGHSVFAMVLAQRTRKAIAP